MNWATLFDKRVVPMGLVDGDMGAVVFFVALEFAFGDALALLRE